METIKGSIKLNKRSLEFKLRETFKRTYDCFFKKHTRALNIGKWNWKSDKTAVNKHIDLERFRSRAWLAFKITSPAPYPLDHGRVYPIVAYV